jgi:hypothetical protein
MNLHLTTPRASTLVLLALVIAFLVSTPLPLAVAVALLIWALHTPAALVAGIALVGAWKLTHPKGSR